MPRWLLPTALFVSLALNVFVVGAFVGGRIASGRPQVVAPPPAGEQVRPRNPLAAAVRQLTPEQQAAWRAQMPEYGQTFGPRMREARQLVRRTLVGFGDEPFDAAAKLAALKQARAVEAEGRVEMDRRIVTFAATLPAQDRARFGEALARPAQPRLGGRRAGDGGALADR
jgi:uncharacterized membrane protein